MKQRQGFLQISFGWMFALIIGIFIIFLAVFTVSKFIDQGQTQGNAETSASIGVLLNPLETGFEEGKTTSFSLAKKTRIYNTCDTFGSFGNQIIEVQQENFNKLEGRGFQNKFENKYIFSNNPIEGKNFLIFSKPFSLPFKITDLVYLTSTEEAYCFLDSPERIQEEIQNLKQPNLQVDDCEEHALTVCFSNTPECDIRVRENEKAVEKDGNKVYYEEDALLYAAIFSQKQEYECTVKRLSKRAAVLSEIYNEKSSYLTREVGCTPNFNVLSLKSLFTNLEDSGDLFRIASEAENIDKKNDFDFRCSLW